MSCSKASGSTGLSKGCARFYVEKNGRPALTPGIYFRSLLIGYIEGIESERGITSDGRLLGATTVSGHRAGRSDAGSLGDLAYACGDAPAYLFDLFPEADFFQIVIMVA